MTAFAAFAIWSAFPLYFKQLSDYDSFEIIGHRVMWTFVCILIVLTATRRWQWIQELREKPSILLITFVSGVLIATNWLTYVWAVNSNQLLAASLGYFICPLIGILMSMLFLKERLRPLQWIAVGLALISVIIQVILLGSLPWVSLVIAGTFSIYGIMQRRTLLKALDGLFIETILLVPFFIWWFWQADVNSSHLSFWFSRDIWLLMLAGPITLIPLLLFNKSTKQVAYSILSFMNYMTPSLIFCLAVFYYDESFDTQRLLVFGLIWIALLLFSIDLWRHRPSKQLQRTASANTSTK
ncbi:EamA family transporter RarD [Psychrobacter sp. I-STPA10]|uniref:EamA family transporter RarD n=1 Tax=Psychrobacter sp. I-STPA10 TaxID=2585769 RepID=UPI001E3D29C4|nr:EamA family transporter RarD [Psychrobacter sp. I-STPA10]